jgi:hypothetical protein
VLKGADRTRAQFADSYGAINALFSGLALGGVILAIFMQRDELQLQRQELTATREELQRTADAQQSLSDTADRQVHTLLLTAKLNALSAMVNHYASKRVFDEDRSARTGSSSYWTR